METMFSIILGIA